MSIKSIVNVKNIFQGNKKIVSEAIDGLNQDTWKMSYDVYCFPAISELNQYEAF